MERKISGFIPHREAIRNPKIKFTQKDLDKVKRFDQVGLKLAKVLPRKSNNYPKVAPARFNQGDLGLCFAFALAGIVEFFLRNEVVSNPITEELSEMYIGYYGRYVLNDYNPPEGDQGCTILASIMALKEFGICRESTWKYIDGNENVEPSEEAKAEAALLEAGEVFAIPQTQDDDKLQAMKQVLYAGRPLDFGAPVHQSIMSVGDDGKEPYAEIDSEDDPVVGGHARQVIDYDDDMEIPNAPIKGAFLVMNSWGPDWGNNGTSWVSYQCWLDIETDDMGLTSLKMKLASNKVNLQVAEILDIFQRANYELNREKSQFGIRRARPLLIKGINLLKEMGE